MNTTKYLLSLIFLLSSCTLIIAQSYNKTITETAIFSKPNDKVISVHNINGSIEIIGYNGNEAVIEADQKITAKTNKYLEIGKSEIEFRIVETDEAIVIYVEQPNAHFDVNKRSYTWANDHYTKSRYKHHFDIRIKVPFETNIEAATMNDGDLFVKDIWTSEIQVNNLNGSISLDNVSGMIDANALNEDIDVVYRDNPTEDSWFNSLNGDINISLPNALDAEVFFESMNGHLYSNMDATPQKPQLLKTVSRNKKKTKYTLDKDGAFTFGAGGPKLHFNQLNGDTNLMNE